MFKLTTIKVMLIVSLCVLLVSLSVESRKNRRKPKKSEESMKRLLKLISRRNAKIARKRNLADWYYGTNITDANQQKLLKEVEKSQKFDKYAWSLLKNFNAKDYKNESVRRQIDKYSVLGISVLGDRAIEFTKLVKKMETMYGEAKICVKGKCDIPLDPDLTDLMANEGDYDTLKEAWVNWRDATGKKIRPLYDQYVQFGNEMSVKNRDEAHPFNDYGDYLLAAYELPTIKQDFEKVWKEVEPFYKELHAFVRMKLKAIYGDKMPSDGTIPAHLLGNMWAQSWTTLLRNITPYPNAQITDVTPAMVQQKYDATRIFRTAEKFYESIGLFKMVPSFWKKSMLTKPKDRDVVCHPMSWDFADGKDYRIRECTEPTMEHLITAHHEMGHSQYFMSYRDQPFILRDGANPGFHEAIGDTIALSVSTPKYLQSIGLLNEAQSSQEALINYQLKIALDKVAFLPFGYIVDLWRWDVFAGKITPDNYNEKWWEYRTKYQGVSPPVKRTEDDFDPGAKYHVPADITYISYFVAAFLQFQFHESLCKVAKQSPLYECSIAGNKEAGAHLHRMLRYGSSIPWPRQLKEMTGSEKLSAESILQYFEPLRKYLKNAVKNERIGWGDETSGPVGGGDGSNSDGGDDAQESSDDSGYAEASDSSDTTEATDATDSTELKEITEPTQSSDSNFESIGGDSSEAAIDTSTDASTDTSTDTSTDAITDTSIDTGSDNINK